MCEEKYFIRTERSARSQVHGNNKQRSLLCLLLLRGLSARRVLQQLRVDLARGQLHVLDDGAADEAVLHGLQVREVGGVLDAHAEEFDVEVLVDGVQLAADGEVILQLDDDLLADERLEEGIEDRERGACD